MGQGFRVQRSGWVLLTAARIYGLCAGRGMQLKVSIIMMGSHTTRL